MASYKVMTWHPTWWWRGNLQGDDVASNMDDDDDDMASNMWHPTRWWHGILHGRWHNILRGWWRGHNFSLAHKNFDPPQPNLDSIPAHKAHFGITFHHKIRKISPYSAIFSHLSEDTVFQPIYQDSMNITDVSSKIQYLVKNPANTIKSWSR
jgi:hypothetical protein